MLISGFYRYFLSGQHFENVFFNGYRLCKRSQRSKNSNYVLSNFIRSPLVFLLLKSWHVLRSINKYFYFVCF